MPSRAKMAVWKVVAIAYGCAFAVDEPRVHAAGTFGFAQFIDKFESTQI